MNIYDCLFISFIIPQLKYKISGLILKVQGFKGFNVKPLEVLKFVCFKHLISSSISESIAGVCEFFPKGSCTKGTSCPLRHVKGDRTIVCKHWLRGLCKKGDLCEFLHEYDMTKMPECYFYSRFSKYKFYLMINFNLSLIRLSWNFLNKLHLFISLLVDRSKIRLRYKP
jgi:hypothetical protein